MATVDTEPSARHRRELVGFGDFAAVVVALLVWGKWSLTLNIRYRLVGVTQHWWVGPGR